MSCKGLAGGGLLSSMPRDHAHCLPRYRHEKCQYIIKPGKTRRGADIRCRLWIGSRGVSLMLSFPSKLQPRMANRVFQFRDVLPVQEGDLSFAIARKQKYKNRKVWSNLSLDSWRSRTSNKSASVVCFSSVDGDGPSNRVDRDKKSVIVRPAFSSAEYRAAAYLRAQCFYGDSYPEGRSEFTRRSHVRMKADEMWQQLEDLCVVDTTHNIVVIPLIAIGAEEDFPRVTENLDDLSVALPSENGPQYVIGTLDINIGFKLPSEELIGKLPSNSIDAHSQRGYLSNVCVLSSCRRLGIGSLLIDTACDTAFSKGVHHLYVHAVSDNHSARKLYESVCKFDVEQQEEEKFARGLNRPSRILFHRKL